VHFGYGRRMSPIRHTKKTFGDVGRAGVRLASLEVALDLLEEMLADVDAAR
jgi:nicotinamide-nucleotide amidase